MDPVEARHAHWSESATLAALRDSNAARAAILATGCSEAGLAIMMGKGMPLAIRLEAVPLKPAILIKQEAISAGGDAAYSGKVAALSCDRTDIVLLLSEAVLPRFIAKLERQPFGLRRLAAKLSGMTPALLKPRRLKLRDRPLELGKKAYIMGILNVTPDSFSDGSLHYSLEDAISHALRMMDEGADVIDIGGESTRPGSGSVDAEEELRRVLGPVRYLAERTGAIISVDTMKPEVAEAVLEAGAHMINDVSGLSMGPGVAEACARHEAGLVLMHMRGTPADMMRHTDYSDLVSDISSELLKRVDIAIGSGMDPSSIVLDPGFGFSKTANQNIELLMRLPEFVNLGYPVLAGLSRKSTIGLLADEQVASRRVPGSIAALTAAIMAGADIVRVHDVYESVQAAKVAFALRKS